MRILSFISHSGEYGALASRIALQAQRAGEGEVAVIRLSSDVANDGARGPDSTAPRLIRRDIADLLPELERQYREGLALAVIDTPAGEPEAARQAIALSDLVAIPTATDMARLVGVKDTLDAVETQAKPFVFIVDVPPGDPEAGAETAIMLCQYGTVSPVRVSLGAREPGAAANDDSAIARLWDYLRTRLGKVAPADGEAAEPGNPTGEGAAGDVADRRRYRRWTMQAQARLTLNGDVSTCTVINISGGGALVKSDARVDLGDVLFVTDPLLGDFEAEVRHIGADGTFGVEFTIDPTSKDKLAKRLENIAAPDAADD